MPNMTKDEALTLKNLINTKLDLSKSQVLLEQAIDRNNAEIETLLWKLQNKKEYELGEENASN